MVHDAVAEVPAVEEPFVCAPASPMVLAPVEEPRFRRRCTRPNLAPDAAPADARMGLESWHSTISISASRRSWARTNTRLWSNSEARAVAKVRMAFVRSSGSSAAVQTTEASDAHEPALLAFCARQIYPPQGSHPMHVHELARAPGFLAKNDRFDAIAISPAPALANSSQHAGHCAKFAD